jgi:hypothetical protein
MSLEQTVSFLSKGKVNDALLIMKKDAKEFKSTAGIEVYKAFRYLFHPNAPHKDEFVEIAKLYYKVLLLHYE